MPDLDEMIEQLRRMKAPAGAAKPWYEVRAEAGRRAATVQIYDEIGWFGTSAKTFRDEITALDVDEIDVRLNSPGGEAWDGLAIYNTLRGHPATVTVTVDGLAASAASVVAMAGDKIRMNRGSQMMVHDAWGLAIGNAADMLKRAEMLDTISDSLADIYAARAGGTRDQWRAVMRDEAWYTAQEAVDAGLADSLVDEAGDGSVSARYDLTAYAFAHAGRAAAPPPTIFTARPAPAAPGASSCPPQSAAEAIRRVHAAATKTTTASPAGGTKEGASQVDPVKLREALGLAPDASDDEVKASALASLNLTAAPAAPPEGTPAAAASIPAAAAPGTVVLSESAWQETQNQLKTLAAFVDKTKRDERDQVLAKAISDGKFTPAQKEQFAKLWDSNPDGTRGLIDSMRPNAAFATSAVGYATADGDDLDREYQAMTAGLPKYGS